jgi:Zn-dependent protease with chaperone function
VNTTSPAKRHTSGLTWRSVSSPAFEKWDSGIFAGLLVGWTYAPLALWFAFFGAFAGVVGGAFGGATWGVAQTLHLEQGAGFGAAVIGLFVGAFSGLVVIYTEFYNNIPTILGGLLSGLAASLFTLWLIVHFEDQLLRLRGCRDLSRREKQLIDPMVDEILRRMEIVGHRPAFYVSDHKQPAAWTHAKSIVITQGLFGSYDDSENPPVPDMPLNAFSAVIAHEINHWARADGVGIRAVWACCWPIVAIYNAVCLLGKKRQFVALAWFLFWPAWVSIKLIVIPMLTKAMREAEYEADAGAASLGDEYRAGLRTALQEFQEDWEVPRTGWEDVLHATHPPIEHRLERLEVAQSPPTVISRAGMADLTVTEPQIIEATDLCVKAQMEGDTTRLATLERNRDQAIAAWLRTVKQAKERGDQTGVGHSLAELDVFIADFDRRVDGGVSLTLTSPSLGDIPCRNPVVLAVARRLYDADRGGDNDAKMAIDANLQEAIATWLRSVKGALEKGEPVELDETVEGLGLRIADYENKAAALRDQLTGRTTALLDPRLAD